MGRLLPGQVGRWKGKVHSMETVAVIHNRIIAKQPITSSPMLNALPAMAEPDSAELSSLLWLPTTAPLILNKKK